MTLALTAFVGLPILVATGLPRIALAAVGLVVPSIDPLGAGPLGNHLYVYVPSQLQGAGSAIDLFSASVVAQCAHCNLTEHTVYAWVLERVPLPPDL